MNVALSHTSQLEEQHITISGSKSETNRLLLLQALYPNISLKNISDSDDSKVMQQALESSSNHIDIHHCGTAMRFLTAFFSTQEGRKVILTGSSRMQERPIGILVDALKSIGANIEYVDKSGFPPLKIKGQKLWKNKISISANVSSQYISALLLIAPKLPCGLEITLKGYITSRPYIEMTLSLLNQIGVETSFIENTIKVLPKPEIKDAKFVIESDWSSASYFYSIIALSEIGTEIKLSNFKKNSLQSDKVLVDIYKNFGVDTTFEDNSITLKKSKQHTIENLILDLSNSPDIAQTITVTCFGLGIRCELNGLHTLKIKETDRLSALKKELQKIGGKIAITDSSLKQEPNLQFLNPKIISTYQDHRMAMAFAPLALRTNIMIEDAHVVSKSYPNFWEDLKKLGFRINEI